jgi:hypothetical protein
MSAFDILAEGNPYKACTSEMPLGQNYVRKRTENRENIDGPTTLVVLETAALSEAAAPASSTVRGRRPGFL